MPWVNVLYTSRRAKQSRVVRAETRLARAKIKWLTGRALKLEETTKALRHENQALRRRIELRTLAFVELGTARDQTEVMIAATIKDLWVKIYLWAVGVSRVHHLSLPEEGNVAAWFDSERVKDTGIWIGPEIKSIAIPTLGA